MIRVEARLAFPQVGGFAVGVEAERFVAFVDGGVEAVGVETPALGEQFPGPTDGFFLEIVAEAPVAEHLEKRMVVGVMAYLFEVVVLARNAEAFLRIGGAQVIAAAFVEEDILKLIHPGVGKEQRRVVVRHERPARDDLVLLLAEER